MDPEATWVIMKDESEPFLVRLEAATALTEWVKKGGHLPKGVTADEFWKANNVEALGY